MDEVGDEQGRRDRELAARAGGGDAAAFGLLVGRHRPALLRVARRALDGSGEEAEDAVQDALLSAYRALSAGKRPANVRAWLFAIVRNACVDRHRARRPTAPLEDQEELRSPTETETAAVAEQRASVEALLQAIAALPERQRELVVARELGGSSYAELASRHGTTVPAVKSLLLRARRTLVASRGIQVVSLPVVALARRVSGLLGAGGDGLLGLGAAAEGGGAGAAGAGAGAAAALAGLVGKAALVTTLATGVLLSLPAARPGSASGDGPSTAVAHAAVASRGDRHARTRTVPAVVGARPAPGRRVASAPPPRIPPRTAPASHPEPAPRTARAAIAACVSGAPLARRFSAEVLARARDQLPADVAEYSDCADRLAEAQVTAEHG